MFHPVSAVVGGESDFSVACVDARTWCRRVRRWGLSRPWDVLFPPEELYRSGSSFHVGHDMTFVIVMRHHDVIAAYVLGMREEHCCLVDVRSCNSDDYAWCERMFDHWEQHARARGATAVTGPVGAFAFLTDGVACQGGVVESIHIPQYPRTIVDSFQRRGYVHAWSGTIWGRDGAAGTSARSPDEASPIVQRGTWMNLLPTVRLLETVLSSSFASLPWHRGSGAALSSLARRYMLVGNPSLMLTARMNGQAAGAVLMYRDIARVPAWVSRLPRLLRDAWLLLTSRRSSEIHVSVIGIVPESRNSRIGIALFSAASEIMNRASRVTTSWIRDNNLASSMMARRAGLVPLEQRFVYTKDTSTFPFTSGERE